MEPTSNHVCALPNTFQKEFLSTSSLRISTGYDTVDGWEIPNNHRLDVKKSPVVNNGIVTTNLNWWVYRTSEPSTVVLRDIYHFSVNCLRFQSSRRGPWNTPSMKKTGGLWQHKYRIYMNIPTREPTYATWGKGKSSSKVLFLGIC